MLHFILGTAGTGKTSKIMERIGASVASGNEVILLVPEQYSFEAERTLYRQLGPKRVLQVEVLSFTRLCNAVFRRFGGLAGTPVTEAGKYTLMSAALCELKDTLQVYAKSVTNISFLETLVSTCSEFKTAGLAPGRLGELADACEVPELRAKLEELSLVYSTYQGMLERGYTDPDDDLIRACKLLQNNDFFGGYHVFIDGFTTFMAAEFALLSVMIGQAAEVTVAFTADQLHDEQKGTGVFSPSKAAAGKLIRFAGAAGVKVAPPEVLVQPLRYAAPELAHLSAYLLQPVLPAYEKEQADAVQLLLADDIYTEAEYVAAVIADLVREQGYRYREIAVVARDTEPYLRSVQAAFARYHIPFFADGREEVENHPLISGVLAALDAVRSNFDGEAVLSFAKSPVMGLDMESVALLDNYCYSWGIRGMVWTMPFANNPRGLSDTLTEEDTVLLAQLNEVRGQLMNPLLLLKEALKNTNGKRFAQGLYDFLQMIQAAEHLTAYAQEMGPGEKESFLDASAQLWDILIEILDVFGSVLGGVAMQSTKVCELFRLAVNTAEVAQVPQTLDQVLVGGADRIRPGAVKAVFIIGANEGVFPAQVGGKGLFTDSERQALIDLGAELSPPTLQQSILERYYAYFALTLPSHRLYVSYSKVSPVGREQQPSVLFDQLRQLFPGKQAGKPKQTLLLMADKPALEYLAGHYRMDTPDTAALLQYLSGNNGEELLSRIHQAAENPSHLLRDRQIAHNMFGYNIHLSPSRVERYYRCPFSYFAADGLSLKKRKKVEFSPLESGSVIHNVLQVMVQRHGGKGLAKLPQKQLSAEIKEIITDYLAQRVENLEALPARFRYLFTRLVDMLARLLLHLGKEFAQSAFEPVAFELPIHRTDGVPPLALKTIDGKTVSVEGIVDRVDIMEKNGRRYVRVVDYKSGRKDFKLHDILYGLNLQMLLYLFTIQENGTGVLADCIPAGVLYMPVREKYTSTERDTSDQELAKEQVKQWRMSGLLLEDEDVLKGMEQDVAGIFIPAKLAKSGKLDAKSSVASLAEMGKLTDKVKQLIVDIADSLSQGKIPACPTLDGDFDTCAYCDYRAVCGFEPGDPVREIDKIDRGEFFKRLEEESNG